jgi:excinuclease ABC subunit C
VDGDPVRGKLRMLPDRSGVYLFKDSNGRVLYVGKAKRLHLRVRSYFRGLHDPDGRLGRLVSEVADLDTIVTANETEALILEANLIRRHRPRFNIALKDDKSYPFLKLSLYHAFPGLTLTRRVEGDGSRYFGPYTHVKDLRKTLKMLRRIFPLRNCTDRRIDRNQRECLEYFIDRCPGPCTHRIQPPAYAEVVRRLIRFLEGDVSSVVGDLREQMVSHASELRFEESARLRDAITTLNGLALQQRMTPALPSDTDIIGIVARGDRACGVVMHVRDGKILGKDARILTGTGGARQSELLRGLITLMYLDSPQVPPLIVTGDLPREAETLQAWLMQRTRERVRFRLARGGEYSRLHALARENAHIRLEEEELRERNRRASIDSGVYDLQERLGLMRTPYRIEGYDISNLQSTHPVASMVTFQDGIPLKAGYRRFRIKRTEGPDDVAMIGEVVLRRFERLKADLGLAPDLVLIDGGPNQVNRAREVLREQGFGDLLLIGLAKRDELVVVPGQVEPIRMPRNSAGLKLLQRVRDEAHRFAVSYHRKLRSRAQTRSALDLFRGIGPRRRALLLRRFGSVEAIRAANEDDLAAIPGIGPETARKILEGLRSARPEAEGQQGIREGDA